MSTAFDDLVVSDTMQIEALRDVAAPDWSLETTDDKLAMQRRIVGAVRDVDESQTVLARRLIRGMVPGVSQIDATTLAALAAVCADPAIWDALCHVRQVFLVDGGP